MKPDEVLVAIGQLPRFDPRRAGNRRWHQRGSHFWIPMFDRVPFRVDSLLKQCIDKGNYDDKGIVFIDSRKIAVGTLQTRLKVRSLRFAVRNFSRVQRWRKTQLPVLVKIGRKLVLWDGHHRYFASMLLNRRLRCRLIEVPCAR